MGNKTAAVATLQIDNVTAGLVANAMFNVPSGNFESVSGNYQTFEDGQTYNFVCMGLIAGTDYNDQSKVVEDSAVELITANGIEVINQDVVMISTAKKLKAQNKPFPCMLRVYCNGTRQNSKGKDYKDLQILRADITPEILAAIGK